MWNEEKKPQRTPRDAETAEKTFRIEFSAFSALLGDLCG
jgi:hypothetical protein